MPNQYVCRLFKDLFLSYEIFRLLAQKALTEVVTIAIANETSLSGYLFKMS